VEPLDQNVDKLALELEQLYRDRYVGLRDALATVTGSHESARDALQEGFARALAARSSYRGEGPLVAWVWRISYRAALESRRHEFRYLEEEQLVEPRLVHPDRDAELATALRDLSPRRRLILFLRYYADCSHTEIASICGISEGTVSATLAKAKEALRISLKKEALA
jgi:RNA polymerase sigma-70 factor (ECF subfamily)